MVPAPFRVTRRVPETHDTCSLELEPVTGEPFVTVTDFHILFSAAVGRHTDKPLW